MPEADPAERVVDRREPGDEAKAALQLRLQLGERDVRVASISPRSSVAYGASSGRRCPP
jgi:hypothetical protein